MPRRVIAGACLGFPVPLGVRDPPPGLPLRSEAPVVVGVVVVIVDPPAATTPPSLPPPTAAVGAAGSPADRTLPPLTVSTTNEECLLLLRGSGLERNRAAGLSFEDPMPLVSARRRRPGCSVAERVGHCRCRTTSPSLLLRDEGGNDASIDVSLASARPNPLDADTCVGSFLPSVPIPLRYRVENVESCELVSLSCRSNPGAPGTAAGIMCAHEDALDAATAEPMGADLCAPTAPLYRSPPDDRSVEPWGTTTAGGASVSSSMMTEALTRSTGAARVKPRAAEKNRTSS